MSEKTVRKVIQYKLAYDTTAGNPQITLGLEGDAENKVRFVEDLKFKPEHLLYVVHMLRYEKPIYFNTDTRTITTGFEPTGEEEGKGG